MTEGRVTEGRLRSGHLRSDRLSHLGSLWLEGRLELGSGEVG